MGVGTQPTTLKRTWHVKRLDGGQREFARAAPLAARAAVLPRKPNGGHRLDCVLSQRRSGVVFTNA